MSKNEMSGHLEFMISQITTSTGNWEKKKKGIIRKKFHLYLFGFFSVNCGTSSA